MRHLRALSAALLCLALACGSSPSPAPPAGPSTQSPPSVTPIRLLVLTATTGFRHTDGIAAARQVLPQMAATTGEFTRDGDRRPERLRVAARRERRPVLRADDRRAGVHRRAEGGDRAIRRRRRRLHGRAQRDRHALRLARLRPADRRVLQRTSVDAGGDGHGRGRIASRDARSRREFPLHGRVLHVPRQPAAAGERPARRSTPRRSGRRATSRSPGRSRLARAARSTPRSGTSRARGRTRASRPICAARSNGWPSGSRDVRRASRLTNRAARRTGFAVHNEFSRFTTGCRGSHSAASTVPRRFRGSQPEPRYFTFLGSCRE